MERSVANQADSPASQEASQEDAPVTGGGRRAFSIDPLDRQRILILVAVVLISLVLRVVTWDVIADGGQGRFVRTALLGGIAAVVIWGLIRVQTSVRSWLPLICALLVLFAGDAIHYIRLLNPITRGGPVIGFTSTFSDEVALRRQWDVETNGGGRVSVESGMARIESPSGGSAYVIARLPEQPDVLKNWWLPVGLIERERAERLTWLGAVQRTGNFYVVAEIKHLLIQVVGYGLHITYPNASNAAVGHEIQTPIVGDGQPHDWRVTRQNGEIKLDIDGKQLWTAPAREPLDQVRLGDPRTDREHGGTLRLQSVSYAVSLSR
jgi:hypothetical protein